MSFSNTIVNWYLENKRDLPWRKTQNPYHIWLSEIMLQQTRVEQGLPYYLKFTKAYPTVFDLANAPEEEILKLWQGLGYYSRARNLHATAKFIAYEKNGKFPSNYKDLLKLKGIGDYTASAIASICFDEPAPVVDGNVYRVLSRYYGVEIPINSTEGIKYFKTLATEVINIKDPATHNQAIMEFGAMQCKPKNPHCMFCPLNSSCVSLQKGWVEKLPIKIRKGKIKKRYFNYLVISDSEKTIFQQRLKKDVWQHLYEFPLIESDALIDKNEISKHNLISELLKDTSYEITLFNKEPIIHKLSHQHIYTQFWVINLESKLSEGIKNNKIKSYAMPVLIANFVEDYGF